MQKVDLFSFRIIIVLVYEKGHFSIMYIFHPILIAAPNLPPEGARACVVHLDSMADQGAVVARCGSCDFQRLADATSHLSLLRSSATCNMGHCQQL
jgi:hypothetical protein